MIFFAVAAPTPGSASSCDWVAVLSSTGPAGTALAEELFRAEGAAGAMGAAGAAGAAGAMAEPLTVTRGETLVIVFAETPAFDRSPTEL
jgi:hypothetical protein